MKNSFEKAEIGLLAVLCFSLPLWEAPKNLAWLAYAAVWIFNRARRRDFGGPWGGWDTLIAAWIASGYIVAAFAGLHGSEWRGAGDLLKYGSLFWLVKRARYSDKEIIALLGTLVASTVIGLAQGYWRLWSGTGKSGTLQLNSVGHVNHTAVYIAIMLALCASWLFARWRAWRAGPRAAALAICALVLVSLVVTASRDSIVAGLLALIALGIAWWPKWRTPLVAAVATMAVVIAVAFSLGLQAVRKFEENLAAGTGPLSLRDSIWRTGLVAWQRYPLFGVGMDNYSAITQERVKGWLAESGKPYDAARYQPYPHAHSLYINTLAERGVFGLGVLVAVLGAWLAALWGLRPRPPEDDLAWLLWGGAAGAWFVSVVAGTLNTTLHHEHAILALLLLGLWLSRRTRAY